MIPPRPGSPRPAGFVLPGVLVLLAMLAATLVPLAADTFRERVEVASRQRRFTERWLACSAELTLPTGNPAVGPVGMRAVVLPCGDSTARIEFVDEQTRMPWPPATGRVSPAEARPAEGFDPDAIAAWLDACTRDPRLPQTSTPFTDGRMNAFASEPSLLDAHLRRTVGLAAATLVRRAIDEAAAHGLERPELRSLLTGLGFSEPDREGLTRVLTDRSACRSIRITFPRDEARPGSISVVRETPGRMLRLRLIGGLR